MKVAIPEKKRKPRGKRMNTKSEKGLTFEILSQENEEEEEDKAEGVILDQSNEEDENREITEENQIENFLNSKDSFVLVRFKSSKREVNFVGKVQKPLRLTYMSIFLGT